MHKIIVPTHLKYEKYIAIQRELCHKPEENANGK